MPVPVSWASWLANRPCCPWPLAIPVVVIIAILSLAGTFKIPEGPVDYSAFFPTCMAEFHLFGHYTLFYLLASMGIGSFWKDMKRRPHPRTEGKEGFPFFRVLGEILSHSNFSGCGSQRTRQVGPYAGVLWIWIADPGNPLCHLGLPDP